MDSAKTIDLNRLAKGDPGEWIKLVDCFYEFMLKRAVLIVKDIHSAKDVVQQVLMNLWVKKSQFGQVESLAGYLARATKNAAITHLRQLATEKTLSIQTEIAEPVEKSRQSDPLTVVCLGELSRAVSTARVSLSPRQRGVVDHLLLDGDSSMRQVGRYVGCSHQNVRGILRRIRPKFRQADELLRR